jgi:rRNA maturation protein Nop10
MKKKSRPSYDLFCPDCGALNRTWAVPLPGEHLSCSECGGDLKPPKPEPPQVDHVQWRTRVELEAGAAKIRAQVDEIKRRR